MGPHWVQNGPEASVSLSITFHTPVNKRKIGVHAFNAKLRRIGLKPAPPGRRPGARQRRRRTSAGPQAQLLRAPRPRSLDFPAVRNPRDFFQPQAIGAPEPLREIPVTPSRMIHFLDFSNEKMVEKAAGIAEKTDILLGNLEDAIPVDRKEAARQGLVKAAKESDFG